MKVGIVIICYNISAEVFLLQIAAVKKFCRDEDYVIHVIDNSDDKEIAEHIRYHASVNGIDYTKTFSNSKGSSDSHSWAANFSYQKFKDDYKLMLFLDHDCIPVEDFSIEEILSGGHVAAGVGQPKLKKYPWPGLFFLNNDAVDHDIVDFSPNSEFGLDTGGNLYKIIEEYGSEAFRDLSETYHQNKDYITKEYGHYSMLANETFMHFIAGSNWINKADHQHRISSLVNIAKEKTGL